MVIFCAGCSGAGSRPARGAWVEMLLLLHGLRTRFGRAPQGARGLKFLAGILVFLVARRAPQGARGLKWVGLGGILSPSPCRAPQGARGLKCKIMYQGYGDSTSRAPQGARGLKFCVQFISLCTVLRRAPQGARGLKWNLGRRQSVCRCRAPQGARGLK